MQQGILGTLFHCNSTDDFPLHDYCPESTEDKPSCCFYRRAEAAGEEPESHEGMTLKLNDAVVEAITPLYEKLSHESLLERCTRGGTQNSNESPHSVIWTYCPKEVFVSKNRIDIGATRAIASFNMGNLKSLS